MLNRRKRQLKVGALNTNGLASNNFELTVLVNSLRNRKWSPVIVYDLSRLCLIATREKNHAGRQKNGDGQA